MAYADYALRPFPPASSVNQWLPEQMFGSLGAYHETKYMRPISGVGQVPDPALGAYHETKYMRPIEGLDGLAGLGWWRGGVSAEGMGLVSPSKIGQGEQALLNILSGTERVPGVTPPINPIATLSPWAKQTGDVTWEDVQPEYNIVAYPITDALLKIAQKVGFGHEVGWCGVLVPRPATLNAVETVLKGRLYSLLFGQGVYFQGDSKPVPTPAVIYWFGLRDDPADPNAGTGTMDVVAEKLGGRLIFPYQQPRTGKERVHPGIRFSTALATANMPQIQPTYVPPQIQPTAPGAGGVPWWVWAVGGAAVIGGVWWYRRKR